MKHLFFLALLLLPNSLHADDKLIKLLGNDEWIVRQRAHWKIKKMGPDALHWLIYHRHNRNLEIKWRVRRLIDHHIQKAPIPWFLNKKNQIFWRRRQIMAIKDMQKNDNLDQYMNAIRIMHAYDKEMSGAFCWAIWKKVERNWSDQPFLYKYLGEAAGVLYKKYGDGFNHFEELLLKKLADDGFDEIELINAIGSIGSYKSYCMLFHRYMTEVRGERNKIAWRWKGGGWNHVNWSALRAVYQANFLKHSKEHINSMVFLAFGAPDYMQIVRIANDRAKRQGELKEIQRKAQEALDSYIYRLLKNLFGQD